MSSNFINSSKKYWKIFGLLYLFVILFFVALNFGLFGKMPSIEELENPKNHMASEIFDAKGGFMGKIFTHNRVPSTYNELPPQLVNALIATEDSRFYTHAGIDGKAILGVMAGMVTGGGRGGGSTITQQLAKNLFPRGRVNTIELIIRKFKEWIIAVKLERNLTKHEIISSYFNTVEFSDNAFGIKAASRTYFSKDVSELSVDEGAVLVGMLRAPYRYNPRIHPEASKQRRNVVLAKMTEHGFITGEEFRELKNKPIELQFNREYTTDNVAPYFVSYLKKYLKKYFKNHPKKDGSTYNIYGDGLKIYTTIDPKMQAYAEAAAREHLSYYQKLLYRHWGNWSPWYSRPSYFMRHVKRSARYKALKAKGLSEEDIITEMKKPVKMKIFSYQEEEGKEVEMSPWDSIKYYNMVLQTGFIAVEPTSGYVKAWVGGADYKHFKFDHVNKNTKRQVGSVFKPFLYATAIDQKGYSPCFQVSSSRIVFRPGSYKWKLRAAWSPSNSGGGYGGMPTLRQALAKSLNTVSARLMYDVGPYAVIETCRNLGIDTNTNIPPYPSICLGTSEISVIEMAGAYTAYANNGIHTEPVFVTKIEDMNGNIIFEQYPEYKEAFRQEVAYVMQDLMRGVINHGTAKRLKGRYGLSKYDICGKTGTTQSNADGWFIGFTPDLVGAVWVGCDDRLSRFRSTGLGQGASMALPIWGKFFNKLSKDKNYKHYLEGEFDVPNPDKLTIVMDCSKYQGWGKEAKLEPDIVVLNSEIEDQEMKFADESDSTGAYSEDENDFFLEDDFPRKKKDSSKKRKPVKPKVDIIEQKSKFDSYTEDGDDEETFDD